MRAAYHIRISLQDTGLSTPASTSYTNRSQPDSNNVFVPTSLFAPLPSHPPKSSARRNTLHHHPRHSQIRTEIPNIRKDYRFGPLRMDWVDFDSMELMNPSKKPGGGKERAAQGRGGPATATFVTTRTKSGSTNLPEGVIHIYRDVPPVDHNHNSSHASKPSTSSAPVTVPLAAAASTSASDSDGDAAASDGLTLAVLAVPSWMNPSDFLAFVAPAADGMAHLRMIRDSAPSRSIVVINFRERAYATEFAEAYNGKPFNSLEPEMCHVVRIRSIEIDTEDFTSYAIRLPPDGTYELPTCPVCLERMDSAVTGLVTVPCSHTFHCACLSKWGDSRCPVCRYSQTLLSSHPTSASSRSTIPIPFTSSSTSQCVDCPPESPSTSSLWICLICGNIGCGRYSRAHAHAHYELTTHLYALELETQRVWDYAGDGYVHRLIQNKADGKLVELPSAASSMNMGANGNARGEGGGPSAADALSAEKIEAIGIEYSYLLTSQLDSQRTYYEEQTTDLQMQIVELRGFVEKLSMEMEQSKIRGQEEQARRQKEEEDRIAVLEREKATAEKRAAKTKELASALERELKGERAVGEGLMKNLAVAKERAEKAEREKGLLSERITELEEQVRDMMFFVEARSKIESGEGVVGEAVGGSIEMSPPSKGKKKGKKG